MQYQRSAGAVVFRRKDNSIEYLVLEYPSLSKTRKKSLWGFPKGMVEKGESLKVCAMREVKEETGLDDLNFLEGFKDEERFMYKRDGELILKVVTYFLMESKSGEVKVSKEHKSYKWLPYDQAYSVLSFKNNREILGRVHAFLEKGQIQESFSL